MRLLSPAVNKDLKAEELSLAIIRIQEARELLNDLNRQVASTNITYQETLAKNLREWEREEEEHKQRISEMEAEVRGLEHRKEQALIPISMYEKKAKDTLSESQQKMADVNVKNTLADEKLELLEDKLTDVAGREEEVRTVEQKQKNRQKSIDQQAEMTAKGSELLTKQIAEFTATKEADECLLADRKRQVELAEINVEAKIEKINREKEQIRIAWIEINDQRETLERAMDRLHK